MLSDHSGEEKEAKSKDAVRNTFDTRKLGPPKSYKVQSVDSNLIIARLPCAHKKTKPARSREIFPTRVESPANFRAAVFTNIARSTISCKRETRS